MYIAKAGDPLEVAGCWRNPNPPSEAFVQLLRVAWEQMLAERKLPVYELANKLKCFYFPKGRAPTTRFSSRA